MHYVFKSKVISAHWGERKACWDEVKTLTRIHFQKLSDFYAFRHPKDFIFSNTLKLKTFKYSQTLKKLSHSQTLTILDLHTLILSHAQTLSDFHIFRNTQTYTLSYTQKQNLNNFRNSKTSHSQTFTLIDTLRISHYQTFKLSETIRLSHTHNLRHLDTLRHNIKKLFLYNTLFF